MKNLLNDEVFAETLARIKSVQAETSAHWGQMNANGMICHITDQVRLATGAKHSAFIGNFFMTTIFKRLVLCGMPTPRGKVPTTKELKQGEEGTPPTTFENDINLLINEIDTMRNDTSGKIYTHPAFGKLNRNEWGRLSYLHIDHHLKQFGV